MSSYVYMFVGVYIKCYYHYEEKVYKYIGCNCGERQKEKLNTFCNKCGHKIVEKEKLKYNKSFDIEKEIEMLNYPNIFYNDNDKMIDILSFDGQDLEALNFQIIKIENIEDKIEKFKEKYINKINILKKYYDKIEIEYGLIQYICF